MYVCMCIYIYIYTSVCIYIYIYIYVSHFPQVEITLDLSQTDRRRLVRDFKDTFSFYPFFESDTAFLECFFLSFLFCYRLAILRIEGCLKSTV